MRVILIAIGMHTKPCIASLAFTARNWESCCNTDLILGVGGIGKYLITVYKIIILRYN